MKKLREELQRERRQRSIRKLIEEGVLNVLAEQEIEQQQAQQQQPQPEPQPQQQAEDPPPVANNQQAQQQIQQQQQEEDSYTIDDMVSELNAIRGGKSFSDPEVYGRLVTFFKNLSEEQKMMLDQLLTKIAELITGAGDEDEDQQAQQAQQQPQQGAQQGAQQGGEQQQAQQPPAEQPQQQAPMPGAQQGAGAAGVGNA